MIEELAATFAAAGAEIGAHLQMHPVEPMYRATFPGESPIFVRHGRHAMTEEIRATCGGDDAAAFGRFCDWLERLYHLEQTNFIDRNFDSLLDLARPLTPALNLIRMGAFRSMASKVARTFADPRLQKLFSFQSLYAGLSPFDALAVYCVITYMDSVEGVWFPEGGIHAVARGLVAAAEKGGAEFRWNAPVSRIVRRHGTSGPVTGVRLDTGEFIGAEAVVANPDLPAVYRQLLPEVAAPRLARKGHYSPSCVLWLAGTRGPLPEAAAHHNIHFGSDWKGSFDDLLRRGTVQADPAILVSCPDITDPALAPPGGHVLYALEPVPNLDGRIDWRRQRETTRQRLVERLAAYGYPVSDVVTERFIDPDDWESMGMERGTPFALSHRFFQSGPFRPGNVDRRVPGLVLVGSGTVPGVSVPMVLVSGRLAAQRVNAMAAL
jgi:phytoene desaturase